MISFLLYVLCFRRLSLWKISAFFVQLGGFQPSFVTLCVGFHAVVAPAATCAIRCDNTLKVIRQLLRRKLWQISIAEACRMDGNARNVD